MADFVESREWYLAAYCPEGVPTSDHLKLHTVTLSLAVDSIPPNHLAVETLLLSVDPYLRGRITGTLEGLFISQYQLNQVIQMYNLIYSVPD
jgi:NADPH-dependent curcumin reductase CurA